MLERNGANHSIRIEIDNSVFTKIMRLDDLGFPKFDVDGISISEVSDFHGLNRRSRNALWTVTPSSSNTTRK